mmetsp:Transcript_41061/g.108503  ORF Transcript_41061/g.108503 Transcript_41061/m.108503 type:complete len:110 (-) Transcript_41061:930-1259(-)
MGCYPPLHVRNGRHTKVATSKFDDGCTVGAFHIDNIASWILPRAIGILALLTWPTLRADDPKWRLRACNTLRRSFLSSPSWLQDIGHVCYDARLVTLIEEQSPKAARPR